MQFTEEQILNLAPDDSSKKSGKDLANPAKWLSKGMNLQALWGECQGSGSKPYQTQVDLANIAFKCSCPSRKFPCKHGLGLLLYKSRQPNEFGNAEMPAWVADWINKRADKEKKQEQTEAKPVDEASRQKRMEAREQKVAAGIEELQLWLKDIVRNGILTMPDKGSLWFEKMAKRMVDAQAPGLANMIRSLGDLNFYGDGWQSSFMDQLIEIYLVSKAYQNIAGLEENLQQDIRTYIGFTQSQEELKEQAGIKDSWLVLTKQSSEQDNITTERYYLYGTSSKQYALILQFIVRGQGGQLTLTPGFFVEAELVFFPSVAPLRAIMKQQLASGTNAPFSGYHNWDEVLQAETNLNTRLPIRGERPYLVQKLIPVHYNQQWWLQDEQKKMMLLKNHHRSIWKLLSLSGGQALNMALIGRESQYEAVGVWMEEGYTQLS